ncbi:procathepsin L-like isoform X1 [Hyaena hyaena]|uniref:procathepsin L-like isoform X1 n=1 Tax=Hyaena hyaena TaxID=95912 RepID=UPI001920DBEB|nr:procathepsin L-like isoform X1 [Hyaena hyaena]
MHPLLFLAAFCLAIASAAPHGDPNLDARWSQWKAAHGKIYNEDDEGWRKSVWETNMWLIEQYNQKYNQDKQGFTVAMNEFADMQTDEEFRNTMNGLKIQKGKNGKMFHIPLFASTSVPVDKRQTTGGKKQGTFDVE